MYLCYIDESGTPEVPGVSSHFVLAGVAIPIYHWRDADREVGDVLSRFGLAEAELHTGWMIHGYREQSRINGFEAMAPPERRAAVGRERAAYLLRLQKAGQTKTLRQTKKTYRHTDAYIHLTRDERLAVVRLVADRIGQWGFARLFAECIDKLHFDPLKTGRAVGIQAFEQVIMRYEQFLARVDPHIEGQKQLSLVIHDNNESVARKHTQLMRDFHRFGAPYVNLNHIVETPLFVDSGLTRMIQIADLCAFALRRFFENGETDLMHRVFPRADRIGRQVVGIRHFTGHDCGCEVCMAHRGY
jgi:hypothetical protein